jgi:hypothetical protein
LIFQEKSDDPAHETPRTSTSQCDGVIQACQPTVNNFS